MFMRRILRPCRRADQIWPVPFVGTYAAVRLLLLVNSSASSVTPRGRVLIQQALGAEHDVTVAETNRRGHASRLALSAARSGIEVVVVLGGDGTLNEAANGLVGTDAAIAALPGGSTNVFAQAIGLPNDPLAAVETLLVSLTKDEIRPIGLGSANGRYFLFHAGIGFDAAVVERVERRSELKRWAGHPLFVWSAVDTWFRHYDRRRPRFTVRSSAGFDVGDAYFAICLNTNPYTYLGSRPISVLPEATIDGVGLGLVVFRSLAAGTLLRGAAAALGQGTLRGQPKVATATGVQTVHIEGRGPVPYQVDGDFLGEVASLEVDHHPEALRLVFPSPSR
jgi:diacylglycerol kinase family enzyme